MEAETEIAPKTRPCHVAPSLPHPDTTTKLTHSESDDSAVITVDDDLKPRKRDQESRAALP